MSQVSQISEGTLTLGKNRLTSGPFSLPLDIATQRLGIIGISGSGKTVTATVLAEEFYEHHLPFIALDGIGNWRGLRAGRDGKSSGYQVVVIGGRWKNIDLDPNQGARYAESLASRHIPAVIDLSTTPREDRWKFCAAFMDELLRQSPDVPIHIFFEEVAQWSNERPENKAAFRCRASVDNFCTTGRNYGYGYTAVTQRPAIVSKTVLSQCGSLILMQLRGTQDLQAIWNWMSTNGPHVDMKKFKQDLAHLKPGSGFYVNPDADKKLLPIMVRQRKSLHPAEAIKLNPSLLKSAVLADVEAFTKDLQKELSKRIVATEPAATVVRPLHPPHDSNKSLEPYVRRDDPRIDQLAQELADEKEKHQHFEKRLADAEARLAKACDATRGLYEALKILHESVPTDALKSTVAGSVFVGSMAADGRYRAWLEKCPRAGIRRCLEVMIEHGRLSYRQIMSLAHVGNRTLYNYMGWLKTNRLVDKEGSDFVLRPL